MLSIKMALVFSSIAAANASGVVSVTHLTPMPKCLKVTAQEVWELIEATEQWVAKYL